MTAVYITRGSYRRLVSVFNGADIDFKNGPRSDPPVGGSSGHDNKFHVYGPRDRRGRGTREMNKVQLWRLVKKEDEDDQVRKIESGPVSVRDITANARGKSPVVGERELFFCHL